VHLRHPPSFRVAGVVRGDIYLRLAWHSLHLVAWRHPPFTWQAWHLVTSIFVSRGRGYSTWRHFPAFGVASVALLALGGALGRPWSPGAPRHFVTHHLCPTHCHTPSMSHTIFHTPLCHTPPFTHHFVAHHFVTNHFAAHHLCHTLCHTPSMSDTIFHTPLCHTPSFTHNIVTHHLPPHHSFTHHFVTHHLSHTIFVTHHLPPHHLSHTTLSHTIFHTPSLSHTLSHTIFHTQLCHVKILGDIGDLAMLVTFACDTCV